MKKLLVCDTHLGVNKSSDMYHEIVLDLFKEIWDVCDRENIQHIIHLGDFFHDRKVLNTKTQAVAHEIAKLFEKDFQFKMILGNHDCYYKEKLNPNVAELLKKYHGFQVIDKPTEFDNILLCPWNTMPVETDAEYCMGHFQFKGFRMNNTYVCDNGQDHEVASTQFKHVYSGHFHTPSNKGNITYLGSPYQITFNDINSPRGYHIWDNGELDFRQYHNAPVFKIIKSDNIDAMEITGNICRLIFVEDEGSMKNQQIIDQVLDRNPIRLQVDFSQIKMEGTEEKMEESLDATLLDHDGIIIEYINKTEIPPKIKKKTLLSMIEKLRRTNG